MYTIFFDKCVVFVNRCVWLTFYILQCNFDEYVLMILYSFEVLMCCPYQKDVRINLHDELVIFINEDNFFERIDIYVDNLQLDFFLGWIYHIY